MRPRTKLSIPDPSESEFENFDRVVKTLLAAKKEDVLKLEKKVHRKRRRRLPRF